MLSHIWKGERQQISYYGNQSLELLGLNLLAMGDGRTKPKPEKPRELEECCCIPYETTRKKHKK